MPSFQLVGIVDDFGIALQFIPELIEGAQAFLCFIEKRHIAYKVFITQWIIHVKNRYVIVFQILAPKHIFISIVGKPFIEWVFQQDASLHDKVGGVKVCIGMSLSLEMISVLRAGRFENVS